MKQWENSAYELFLHSGTVADYMRYIGAKQPTEAAIREDAAGEQDAYYNRRDCPAGACDG